MADKFCAVSFLQISAPEMDDRMLTELLDTDSGLLVSLHIRSMDQNEAIKTVKRKITDKMCIRDRNVPCRRLWRFPEYG